MAKSRAQQFLDFQKTIPPNVIDDWEARIREWDALKDKRNGMSPYNLEVSSTAFYLCNWVIANSGHSAIHRRC